MENFKNNLWNDYQLSIQFITASNFDSFKKIQAWYNASMDVMSKLEEFISTYSFEDDLDEIHFYKEVKPLFLKEVIYYSELFHFASHKPLSKFKLKNFIKKQISFLGTFIGKHNDFYNYHPLDLNDKDLIYFRKNEHQSNLRPPYLSDFFINTVAPYNDLLAKLMAYEKLLSYCNKELEGIKSIKTDDLASSFKANGNFVWTESKAALIELATGINYFESGFELFMEKSQDYY